MRQALVPSGRSPARTGRRARSRNRTFVAPVRGLVTNQNLATAPAAAALVLDNWFPTQTAIKLRGGTLKHATLDAAVTSMFTYDSGSVQRLFAATGTSVFNVTSPADPAVTPTADIASLTGGDWATTQFATSGGEFLIAVNGSDAPREFDGSAWSLGALTGTSLTPSNLSQVWSFKERLFFVEGGTKSFWYLPVGLKAGTLTEFPLQGVFKKGGSLLFGSSWSLDAGDGVDDYCVLVSTEGEVVVYQGTDPNAASTWSLVGVYQTAAPLGKNAHLQLGGDLLIATLEGIIPITQVLRRNPAELSLSAVTLNIEPDWKVEANARGTLPWTLLRHTRENRLIVGLPATTANERLSFVANLETGAWCRFSGVPYDIRGQAVLSNVHYMGTGDGIIYQSEATGSDDGALITHRYHGHFDQMGRAGATKSINLARAVFRSTRQFNPKVSCSVDYAVMFPSAPASVANSTTDAWDEGIWDQAIWDATGMFSVRSGWQAVSCQGFAVAPVVQVSSGVTPKPDAELVSVDLEYEVGQVVTT